MTDEEIILQAYNLYQETETKCPSIAFMVTGQSDGAFSRGFAEASVDRETGDVFVNDKLIGNIFNLTPDFNY